MQVSFSPLLTLTLELNVIWIDRTTIIFEIISIFEKRLNGRIPIREARLLSLLRNEATVLQRFVCEMRGSWSLLSDKTWTECKHAWTRRKNILVFMRASERASEQATTLAVANHKRNETHGDAIILRGWLTHWPMGLWVDDSPPPNLPPSPKGSDSF